MEKSHLRQLKRNSDMNKLLMVYIIYWVHHSRKMEADGDRYGQCSLLSWVASSFCAAVLVATGSLCWPDRVSFASRYSALHIFYLCIKSYKCGIQWWSLPRSSAEGNAGTLTQHSPLLLTQYHTDTGANFYSKCLVCSFTFLKFYYTSFVMQQSGLHLLGFNSPFNLANKTWKKENIAFFSNNKNLK